MTTKMAAQAAEHRNLDWRHARWLLLDSWLVIVIVIVIRFIMVLFFCKQNTNALLLGSIV